MLALRGLGTVRSRGLATVGPTLRNSLAPCWLRRWLPGGLAGCSSSARAFLPAAFLPSSPPPLLGGLAGSGGAMCTAPPPQFLAALSLCPGHSPLCLSSSPPDPDPGAGRWSSGPRTSECRKMQGDLGMGPRQSPTLKWWVGNICHICFKYYSHLWPASFRSLTSFA